MQETKLADDDVPEMPFRMAGYELLHHGEGRWNGVAIASKVGIEAPVTNFGDGPVRESRSTKDAPSADDFDPLDRSAHGQRHLRRHPRRQPLRPQRPGARLALVRGQAALVRPAQRPGSTRSPRPPTRCSWAATSTSRPPTTTSGMRPPPTAPPTSRSPNAPPSAAARVGPGRHLPAAPAGRRPLQLVRLPRRHVPQEHGHAHRPALRHAPGRRARRLGRDRPRGPQGSADTIGPRPGRHRPRRAGHVPSTPAGRGRWRG